MGHKVAKRRAGETKPALASHQPGVLVSSGKSWHPQDYMKLDEALRGFKDFAANVSEAPQEYVVTFVHLDHFDKGQRAVLLVTKPSGTLHAGMLNLPGGKITGDELPTDAALRELHEETGCIGTFPKVIGAIINSGHDETDDHFIVYVVKVVVGAADAKAHVDQYDPPNIQLHKPKWYPVHEVLHGEYAAPSLKLILPLCVAGATDFLIQDMEWGRIRSQELVTFYAAIENRGKKERFTT